MARILITNNGTHSADKWAVTTAEMIFPLDDTALVGERLIAAQKFQTQLAEILAPHHHDVKTNEISSLDDPSHYGTAHDAEHYCDHALEEVFAAGADSPWAEHFAKQDVQDAIRSVVHSHMQSAQHVERLWHAGHNESDEGNQYLAAHHGE